MNATRFDFKRLDDTVEIFCRFIESLPQDALLGGAWGPKEVLAHLVYWHEVYLEQARCVQQGAPVDLPRGRYSDLNALAVQRSKDVDVSALVERLRAANRQLGELYAACDPEQVVLPGKTGVRPYSLAELMPEVEAHVRNHQRKLGRQLRQTKAR